MTDSKKSKFFFAFLSLVVVISILATYYKYVVLKDYQVFTDETVFTESLMEE